MPRELTEVQLLERTINKRFRKELWTPFVAGVQRYGLLEADDRVCVAVSGSADSALCAKLMQELCRHSRVPFSLCFVTVTEESGTPEVMEKLQWMGIPAEAIHAEDNAPLEKILAWYAAQHGCSKLATGTHVADVAEVTLAAMLLRGETRGLAPIRKTAVEGVRLIRPIFCLEERDIRAWAAYLHLQEAAISTPENAFADGLPRAQRQWARALLQQLSGDNPLATISVFNATHNAQADTFPAALCKTSC